MHHLGSMLFFFFSSRRRHTRWTGDWSSDVCSSDLMTLLLLAGLQPISYDLYESADVDGATRWQKFRYITLPLLRPVILVAVALRTIGAFRVFDIIYVLTGNGGPADSTKVISFYNYDQAFHYLFFGYGAAISWIITAFMLVMIVIYTRLLRTEDYA